MIKISDYLRDFVKGQGGSGRGTCKTCGKLIQWNRRNLACHKRATCSGALMEEKQLFKKLLPRKKHDTDSDQ